MAEAYGAVQLSKKLIAIIEERLPETEFQSVDEYVEFIIGEVLKSLEEEETAGDEASYSEEDEERVKARLKAPGYLD